MQFFYPIFRHAMFVGEVEESSPCLIKDTENPLLPLLAIGCLVWWGWSKILSKITSSSPEIWSDVRAFWMSLVICLQTLAGVVYLLLYVEFSCGRVEVLVGHFQGHQQRWSSIISTLICAYVWISAHKAASRIQVVTFYNDSSLFRPRITCQK